MTTATSDLRHIVCGPSPAYVRKQLHAVPDAPVVVRETFIVDRCRSKCVLDIGASGRLHKAIVEVSRKCYAIDKGQGECIETPHGERWLVDLDDTGQHIPGRGDVDVVVCGEVVEHLSNPGAFLGKLHSAYKCPAIITVPNAFSDIGRRKLEQGIENVNIDHVAWYSWRTLETLLSRAGYTIRERYYYNGRPRFAEGLIAVAE